MSWPLFYFVVVGLVIALILVVSLPWIRVRNQNPIDQLRNAQIVKQRLVELEREADEGLISEADKQQAIDELKSHWLKSQPQAAKTKRQRHTGQS